MVGKGAGSACKMEATENSHMFEESFKYDIFIMKISPAWRKKDKCKSKLKQIMLQGFVDKQVDI